MPLTDFISQLPDHIIVNILSRLTMKEAGQTSVLSKRWIWLWTYYPNLDFDVSKTLSAVQFDERSEEVVLGALRPAYLDWVNQVVRSHKGPTIEQFRVQFTLDESYTNQINEWVQFAFQMNVQRLTLDLSHYTKIKQSTRCRFPNITSSPVFHRNQYGISRSLTSLRLVEVDVTDEVLHWFLSTCPLLEYVAVHWSATLLNVEAHAASLKFLELHSCYNLANIVVNAPNLESFECTGRHMPDIKLQLSSHKLANLSVGGYLGYRVLENPWEYYSYLSEIVVLNVHGLFTPTLILEPQFPSLTRLKKLELTVDHFKTSVLPYALLLKECPLLSEVTFKIYSEGFVEPEEEEPELADTEDSDIATRPYNSLKVVNLVGFVGDAIDVELALYLMKNAVKLEKMSFDTRGIYLIGTVLEFEETEEREAARKRAERLVTKLRPGVTSVII